MSLARYLLFEYCYHLLCNESLNAQQSISANFPVEFKCAISKSDSEFSPFNIEQWKFYLYQFDPYCALCNLWKQSSTNNLQQIASESTVTFNNGDCAEFNCKLYVN